MGKQGAAAVGRWGMAIIPAFVLLLGGMGKFTDVSLWQDNFRAWGYPLWAVPVLGALEVAAAAAILWPRTRFAGGVAIVVIMLGAAVTRFVAGQPGAGLATAAVALPAWTSAWWSRPLWLERLVHRPREEAVPASRRARVGSQR